VKHPKYLLISYLVFVLLAVAILVFNFPETSTKVRTYSLDANEQYVSVTVQKNGGHIGVLVFDMDSGE